MTRLLKEYWLDAAIAAWVFAVVVSLSLDASGQLPVPGPTPVPTPSESHVTISTGDPWANPDNWKGVIHEFGPALFVAILFCAYVGWREWRESRQPNNSKQLESITVFHKRTVGALLALYQDNQERNARLRKVLRAYCDICWTFADPANFATPAAADKSKTQIQGRIERITDALDAGPPPVPAGLQISLDDDKE